LKPVNLARRREKNEGEGEVEKEKEEEEGGGAAEGGRQDHGQEGQAASTVRFDFG